MKIVRENAGTWVFLFGWKTMYTSKSYPGEGRGGEDILMEEEVHHCDSKSYQGADSGTW